MFKEIVDIVETLKGAPNEGTDAPWWIIIDPGSGYGSVRRVAGAITGPFFSREGPDSATYYLEHHAHDFGPWTKVYCMSGCYSKKYSAFYKAIKKERSYHNYE